MTGAILATLKNAEVVQANVRNRRSGEGRST